MTTTTVPTVTGVRARAVSVPLAHRLETASGSLSEAPLVLIDLDVDGGVTGRAYLMAYSHLALGPLAALVGNLSEVVAGRPLAPRELTAAIDARFRLLGPKGLPTMALAGVDMAAWDALGRVTGQPVCRLLGGEPRPVPAYGSLRAMRPDAARAEAAELAESGFGAFKGRVGYGALDDDRAVVAALRDAVGDGARIAVDYNQALTVPEAVHRLTRLADEDLMWVEEPTRAEDLAGHARIRERAPMPVQLGENWWGTSETAAAVAAGASDLAMIDVMRIGGVTGWLHAAGLADAHRLPLSSHLFPEVSAHLLAVTPTAHWLEWMDLAGPVLRDPVRPVDGAFPIGETPGFGIEWDPDAVARFAVAP
jgi:mandelate racemase